MSDLSSSPRVSISDLSPKMEVKGLVKRIELMGAVIDINAERDALLHISQIEPGDVKNVGDKLKEGQELTLWIRAIDQANGRVSLTMFKPLAVDWKDLHEGQVYSGEVIRLEKFGAFVNIGAERAGLVHVSEMADGYVKSPGEVVSVGDEIQVKVLGVNRKKGQIELSMKALLAAEEIEEEEEPEGEKLTAMALAIKRAMGTDEPEQAKAAAAREKNARQRAAQEDILKRTLENQINK